MDEHEIRRRTQLEMFLIGLCVGAVVMFCALFLQLKTGLIEGDVLQNRVDHIEKTLNRIDSQLSLE